MSLWEILGFVFGLLSVWLTTRQSVWCWPTGILNVVFFAVMFYQAKLYADVGLMGVYFVLSIYGWYHWSRPRSGVRGAARGSANARTDRTELAVTRMPLWGWPVALLVLVGGTFVLGSALSRTDAAFPWVDSGTTVASLIAQTLLTRKVLENWLVWIAADVVMIGLYFQKELYLTSGLYVVFIGLCVRGFVSWRMPV